SRSAPSVHLTSRSAGVGRGGGRGPGQADVGRGGGRAGPPRARSPHALCRVEAFAPCAAAVSAPTMHA
ncbi:hypothetical protein, partial [Mycobacterium avium]